MATVPKCDNAHQQNGNLCYWKQYFAVTVGSAGVPVMPRTRQARLCTPVRCPLQIKLNYFVHYNDYIQRDLEVQSDHRNGADLCLGNQPFQNLWVNSDKNLYSGGALFPPLTSSAETPVTGQIPADSD